MPLELEIVTPTKLALRATVDSFTGPGAVGEFGILPGHRPLLAALKAGVAVFVEKAKPRKLAIGPGFAEVERDRVIVLTDDVFDPNAFDSSEARQAGLEAARKARDEAEAKLRTWPGSTSTSEWDEARLAFEWATARFEAFQS